MPSNKKLIIETKSIPNPKTGNQSSPGRFSWLVSRKKRRLILFFVTLTAVLLVGLGVAYFQALLTRNILAFTGYWAICFVFAALIVVLALFDLRMLRKEHRARQVQLDRELNQIMEDARKKAKEDNGDSTQVDRLN